MVFFERIESTSELREAVSAPVIAGIPFTKRWATTRLHAGRTAAVQ